MTKSIVSAYNRLKDIFGGKILNVAIIILIIAAIALVLFPILTDNFENYIYDTRQSIVSLTKAPHPDLLIIAIDMQTIEQQKVRWPWPREKIAQVLKLIGRQEPKCIVLDILFQNATDRHDDNILAETIKNIGNIALVSIIEETASLQGSSIRFFEPYDMFAKSSFLNSFVWCPIERDGKLRRFVVKDDRFDGECCVVQVAKKNEIAIASGKKIAR